MMGSTSAPAPAPEVITLKAADVFGAPSPLNLERFHNWIDTVEEACEGRLEIEYLGGPELLSPWEQLDYVSKGTIDITNTCPMYYSSDLPEFDAIHLLDFEVQKAEWMRTSGWLDIYNEACVERKNVMMLNFSCPSHHTFLASTVPITSADWSDLRIRIAGPLGGGWLKLTGATPVTMVASEVLEALGRGILDANFKPLTDLHRAKEYEYTDYLIGPPALTYTGVTIINKDTWDSLPKDLQDTILEATIDWENREHVSAYERERDALTAMLEEPQMHYLEIPPEEYAKLMLHWEQVWDEQFAPGLLPGFAERFEEVMEGHFLWETAYPTMYSEYVKE